MADLDKIRLALAELDHTNDAHWTDDGLPRTGVVQQLANDPTLKRSDINAAAPTFARKDADPPEATGADPGPIVEGDGIVEASEGSDETIVETVEMTEDEVHAILVQNIKDTEAAYAQAQRDTINAQKAEIAARKAMGAAKNELYAKFPPLTAAENIQQWLRSEHERRAAAHGVTLAPPVDAAFARGNTRGWRRPVHLPNGQVVQPVPQSGFSRNRSVDGQTPQSKARPGYTRPTRPAMGVDGTLVQPRPRGATA